MSNEIKECPFCGNDKQHIGSNSVGSFWVCCEDGCGCEGPYCQSEEEAIAAWNRRAAPASAEPVAWVRSKFGDPEAFGEREIEADDKVIQKLPYGTPLYAGPELTP